MSPSVRIEDTVALLTNVEMMEIIRQNREVASSTQTSTSEIESNQSVGESNEYIQNEVFRVFFSMEECCRIFVTAFRCGNIFRNRPVRT